MSFNRMGARARDRFPSDLSDQQWQVLASLLPVRASECGRPRVHQLRRIVDAIRFLVRTGCPWRYLPAGFLPWKTVYWWYFSRWASDGTLHRVHAQLHDLVRIEAGRDPQPSAAIIDSQSVRGADTVPKASRGWDTGKKVNGRKRHIAVDVLGLVLAVVVTPASVQDRHAAKRLLTRITAAHWLAVSSRDGRHGALGMPTLPGEPSPPHRVDRWRRQPESFRPLSDG